MILRRAAFPHKRGALNFDIYVLWLEAADVETADGLLLPVLAEEARDLERIVESAVFQETLNYSLPDATVEIAPSAFGSFYVRILIRQRYKPRPDIILLRSSLPMQTVAVSA